MCIYWLVSYIATSINGQICTDVVDVHQQGTIIASSTGSLVIVPDYNFSCHGRITGYLIRLQLNREGSEDYPVVQVWHPINHNSTVYNKVGNVCRLTADDIANVTINGSYYSLGNVSCTGDNRTELKVGDVIGYYQSNSSRYQLLHSVAGGYTSYSSNNSSLTSINISNVDYTYNSTQPLIQVMYGKVKLQHIYVENMMIRNYLLRT